MKLFLVETLLNLVKSLGNKKKLTSAACGRETTKCTVVSNLGKCFLCTEISLKYRRSVLFSMPCLFVLISHFKPLTEIRTKIRTNWGWSSQKIKKNKPRQNLLVLIKKRVFISINFALCLSTNTVLIQVLSLLAHLNESANISKVKGFVILKTWY